MCHCDHQTSCDIGSESISNDSLVVVDDKEGMVVGHTHKETASILVLDNQTVDSGFQCPDFI